MSDPDLYSTDAWKREAARAKQSAGETPPPISAPTPKRNHKNTDKLETMAAVTGATVTGTLAVISALDNMSDEDVKLLGNTAKIAALIAAPWLLISSAIHQYDKFVGNYDVNKYPAIAVTFNAQNGAFMPHNRAFIEKHSEEREATKKSQRACQTNGGFFSACKTSRIKADSGYPACLAYTYGVANGSHTARAYSLVLDERPEGHNPILNKCSSGQCRRNAGIACNF